MAAGDHARHLRPLQIDRSSTAARDAGIEVNDAVVNANGLIGRVVLTTKDMAKVQLITDSNCAVGALLERTRRQGVLRGDGAGGAQMYDIPSLADVAPGDSVLTAGIDGIYPKGIPVGVVVKAEKGPDLFKNIAREAVRRLRLDRGSHRHSHAQDPDRGGEVRAVRWLRYIIGLLIALTLHSLLDSFFPNALAFFNPYVILVVYYSMGGNVFGAIIAGVDRRLRAGRLLRRDLRPARVLPDRLRLRRRLRQLAPRAARHAARSAPASAAPSS